MIVAPFFAAAHQNAGELVVVPGRQPAQDDVVDQREIGAAELHAGLAEGVRARR
jgi:hypothetical protein